jgi:hypothetical protein
VICKGVYFIIDFGTTILLAWYFLVVVAVSVIIAVSVVEMVPVTVAALAVTYAPACRYHLEEKKIATSRITAMASFPNLSHLQGGR